MSITTISKNDGTADLVARNGLLSDEVVVIPEGVDVYTLPRRPYDFNKGDRRFVDIDRAVDHANQEALNTGVRQAVRKDSREPGAFGRPFYLVQAIGS
jgi:hypothetical protein